MCDIVEALTDDQIEQVRSLFQEYLAQLPLEFGYRNFNAEIDGLPGPYAPPQGKLLLATVVGQPVGCVGLRPFPLPHTCEMKRLYVRPGFRGGKLGRKLVERILDDARALGYSSMRLDSHPRPCGRPSRCIASSAFARSPPIPLNRPTNWFSWS